MGSEVTIVWYDGNEHHSTHGFVNAEKPHGYETISGLNFPKDADIMFVFKGHVEVYA